MDADMRGELPEKQFCKICDEETIVSRCELHSNKDKECYKCHLKGTHMEKL